MGRRACIATWGWALVPGEGSADLAWWEAPVAAEGDPSKARSVPTRDGLTIDALPVRHGPVPALAFRVIAGGHTLVFVGDQNGSNPEFPGFARDADVLVMHHAIPERSDPVARRLHARPHEIGADSPTGGSCASPRPATVGCRLSPTAFPRPLQNDDPIAS